MTEIADDPEMIALRALSAELGRDPRRTQAAGGNTSLKRGDLMWIKASGFWLSQAREQDMFVPVSLSALHAAIAQGDPRIEDGANFVAAALNPRGLRPSIETSVHAVLAHPVIVHIHCVETIALAVRRDRRNLLAKRLDPLDGVNWAAVDYRRPGLPLAVEIEKARTPDCNVIVLGNHGLIVAAASVSEARDRVALVCDALSTPPRAAAPVDIARIERAAAGSDYRAPADLGVHQIAVDPISLAHARGGSLYPDHVIFLGPGIVETRDVASAQAAGADAGGAGSPAMLVIPGVGVLLRRATTVSADAMALCLADVLARIPAGADIIRLTSEDERQLTHWEAEKYRQALDARTARS